MVNGGPKPVHKTLINAYAGPFDLELALLSMSFKHSGPGCRELIDHLCESLSFGVATCFVCSIAASPGRGKRLSSFGDLIRRIDVSRAGINEQRGTRGNGRNLARRRKPKS